MLFVGKRREDQELDEESAQGLKDVEKDAAEIDAGVDEISASIDRLHNIAGNMKEEVRAVLIYICIYFIYFS